MKTNLMAFVVLAFITASCVGIKATADFDNTVDFSQYKTYSYLGWSENSTQLINDFDKRRVESAFSKEFESRNMKYVLAGGDLEISLFLVTEQKTATKAYTEHYGRYNAYNYRNPWNRNMAFSTTTFEEYTITEGTLVCDVFDAAEKRLVWQGIGSGTIEPSSTRREKTIPASVKKIMSLYPVKPTDKP